MNRNKVLKRRVRRRKRRRYRAHPNRYALLSARPFVLSRRPVTMGPGETTARVTNKYSFVISQGTSAVVNMMQDVINNSEFERFLPQFKYWTLVGVKILVTPRILIDDGVTSSGRILVDWSSDLAENILGDDSAKEIVSYNTRFSVFRFAPPDAILLTSSGKPVNYRRWIPTNYDLQNSIPPGYIKITAGFNFFFSVEVVIWFKGNQTNQEISTKKIIAIDVSAKQVAKQLNKGVSNETEFIEEDKEVESIVNDLNDKLSELNLSK